MSRRHRTFRLSDGTIVRDILGAEGGDEDNDEDEDEDADAGGDDDEDEDESPEQTIERLQAELAEATRGRRLSDRQRKKLERELTAAKAELAAARSGKDENEELTEARSRIAELEEQLAERSAKDDESLIREAFRDSDLFAWHNRTTAFKLLDLSDIEVEDGEVSLEDLEEAIKKLAKDHPYLVKTADKAEDDEDDAEDERPKQSGGTFNGRRSSKKKGNEAVLKNRYKVLGTRG